MNYCQSARISIIGSCYFERAPFEPSKSQGPRQDEAKVRKCLTKAKYCTVSFRILELSNSRFDLAKPIAGRKTGFAAAENQFVATFIGMCYRDLFFDI